MNSVGGKRPISLLLLTCIVLIGAVLQIALYLIAMQNIWFVHGASAAMERARATGSNFIFIMIIGVIDFLIGLMKISAAVAIFQKKASGVKRMVKAMMLGLISLLGSYVGTAAFGSLRYVYTQLPTFVWGVLWSAFLLWYFSRSKIAEVFERSES